jgi:hypothetical protein
MVPVSQQNVSNKEQLAFQQQKLQQQYEQKKIKKVNQYLLNAAETGNTQSVEDALNR